MFFSAKPHAIPPESLMAAYQDQQGVMLDCFSIGLNRPVTLEQYIGAFYTSPIFKAERFLLALILRSPSTDAQAQSLAQGTGMQFAIWRTEARTDFDIILEESSGRTKSWLMVSSDANSNRTRLYFGSILVPAQDAPPPGRLKTALFGIAIQLHLVYSRLLLSSAGRNLIRRSGALK